MEREVLPELRHLCQDKTLSPGHRGHIRTCTRTIPSPAPSDSGTPLCPSSPRPTEPHRYFPTSFPNWCPWHIFSEAGVYPETLQCTQKLLKSPISRTPAHSASCSGPQGGVNCGQPGSVVERDPVAATPSSGKPLFLWPAWSAAAPCRPV